MAPWKMFNQDRSNLTWCWLLKCSLYYLCSIFYRWDIWFLVCFQIIVTWLRQSPPPPAGGANGNSWRVQIAGYYLQRPPECQQQQQHLNRKLRSFDVCNHILITFYYSFIESLMTFSFTCWFHKSTHPDRNLLMSTAKVCSRIIGEPIRSLSSHCDQQTATLPEGSYRILQASWSLCSSGSPQDSSITTPQPWSSAASHQFVYTMALYRICMDTYAHYKARLFNFITCEYRRCRLLLLLCDVWC